MFTVGVHNGGEGGNGILVAGCSRDGEKVYARTTWGLETAWLSENQCEAVCFYRLLPLMITMEPQKQGTGFIKLGQNLEYGWTAFG